MKKIFLALLTLILSDSVFAQTPAPKMELKSYGFVGQDSTKNYVVIDIPKASKTDLFKKTLTYINSLYDNPQKAVSAVEGESITINASTDAVSGSNPAYKYPMTYNIVIEFKDGKIKFAPKVVSFSEVWNSTEKPIKYYVSNEDSPSPGETHAVWMIVKKDGSKILFKPQLKKSLDAWVNAYIGGIVEKVKENW